MIMKNIKIIYFCIIILCNILVLEIMGYLAGSFLQKRLFAVFYVEQKSFDDFDHYMSIRDPVLGWPSKHKQNPRKTPVLLDQIPYNSSISLYGDSFTAAGNVSDKDAWSYKLSLLIGCKVDNYGAGGYGTDQSFLRYKLNIDDKSKIVILGHYTGDIYRNVTRFRKLIDINARYSFKPRFILNQQGELELIPIPELNRDEYIKLVKNPNLLSHEYFVLDGHSGIVTFKFPYFLSLIKSNAFSKLMDKLYFKKYHIEEFYHSDHPSKALFITEKILSEFNRLGIERGKTPIILFFPSLKDLVDYKKTNKWSYDNLINYCNESKFNCFDTGAELITALKGRNPAEIFSEGHLNEEGNDILAKIVYRYLKLNKML